MLDEDPVLDHGELGVVLPLADHEFPVHGFAARQELGLGEDRGASTTRGTVLLAALPFGLHAGGALDPGHLVPGAALRFGAAGATATTTATTGPGLLVGFTIPLGGFLLPGGLVLLGRVVAAGFPIR